MYFKKLELYGFKSFVDKTALIFEPGVTAIVGPNGTGKSNISDAIKWVLGEQSAKSMRGAKMEDVIFNGTETRPPVNMSEVSLTLSNEERVLPIDYDEVTITRRLYRSGESEYLLNKTPVRLKDISELLMGTGIGTESYSLLEQGRIDAIISSKPEERRIVFEEASGITRYKKQKNEAMRKLQATEENLLRVNDIVVEVNRQLNSIARQVSKARRFQENFDELKTLDTQYIYFQYQQLKQKNDQLNQEETGFHQEQTELENDLGVLSQEFDVLKTTLSEVEHNYSHLNNQFVRTVSQIEQNIHSAGVNKERVQEFTQRVQDYTRDIENAQKKIKELQEQIDQLQARISAFSDEKNEKEYNLNSRQTAIIEIENQIKTIQKSAEENRSTAVRLLSEHSQIKNELAKLSANISNANARLLRLNQEKEKTSEEYARINTELSSKILEVENLRGKVNKEESDAQNLKLNYEQLNARIKALEISIQDSRQALVGCKSQLEMLEKLNKEYEWFSSAVKSFMLQKEHYPETFSGVHDVLVNLMEVKPGYEVCVETALSEYLQAVVVDNRSVALRLRSFLSEHNIGRIRFITLDSIPQSSVQQSQIENAKSFLEVISCQEQYTKVLAYLLKHSFILEQNIFDDQPRSEDQSAPELVIEQPALGDEFVFSFSSEAANQIKIVGDFNQWNSSLDSDLERKENNLWQKVLNLAPGKYIYKLVVDGQWTIDPNNPNKEVDSNGYENSVIIVPEKAENRVLVSEVKQPEAEFVLTQTLVGLDGEVHSPVGLISRPLSDQATGLFSQKAKMRQLKEQSLELEQDVIKYKHEIDNKAEQLKYIEAEFTQLSHALHEEKISLANRDSERSSIENNRKKLVDELALVDLEIEETLLDVQDLETKETAKKQRLEIVDQEIVVSEQTIAANQELVAVKNKEREQLLVVIAEMKTEFSLLNDQEAALNESFALLNSNLKELNQNSEEFIRYKEDSIKRIDTLTIQVTELDKLTVILEAEKEEIGGSLEEFKEKRGQLLTRFEEIQNKIKEKENHLNFTRNRIRDIDVKKVELNFKTESLITSMRQVYKLELNTLELELPENIDWAMQKEQIDALKGKIDRIGAVNLAAVEEEQELRERADFLKSQCEDLLAAKQTLMQAIHKINRTTKALFLETFEKSKIAFREYFKLLFSGGDAQLQLTEGKDVLDCGVEIVVRPPGKRLQSITLLSGGEKTLTAIALLFAIFKIKPTPFCVLDEMDAPLDESNIDRFTRVLQEFLKSSQFIIITHNKKTIAMADVMYGVTMEQPGISRLVSVKFSEFKDENKTKEELIPEEILN
ncbi:MAG: AAA family ATPase [Candidatus Omnitrophica bacterium]|nr:AAA family ATPase [Candidatus Omnitrophota bacterium]